MKKINCVTGIAILAGLLAAGSASAHEMFLKGKNLFVAPNSDQFIWLVNGTFDKSENSIDRSRMASVNIIANGKVSKPSADSWSDDEKKTYSTLSYKTGAPGTYVIGVSTKPNALSLSREDFIAYLKHDGVLDTLASFEKQSKLKTVRERYSKHVRTIVQVGDKRTDDFAKPLGYPVEIMLDSNPYSLRFGDKVSFRVLYKGKPVANQIVRASYEGFHGHDAGGGHVNAHELRTDADGRAQFILTNKAVWYISLIHMQKVAGGDVDYESNWATLTFQVK